MTPAAASSGAGWLPVVIVLGLALWASARRRRRARPQAPRSAPRRRGLALLIVTGLVGGSVLLGTPAFAQPLSCKESPEPDRPGTGLVGSLDPPTLSAGEPGSVYNEVGYAGLVWFTYDLGCVGTGVFNPAVSTDTWMGNQSLNVAKFAVGGVNWSHYLIADGGKVLDPLDNLIAQGTRGMYNAVFTTWVGPALLILAVLLFVMAMRGDLARQAQRAGFAVAALAVGSAAYLAPIDWAKAADPLLLDGVTSMQEGFLGQVGVGNRDTLPTVLVDQVVYQNWLRGEFGAPDVPQAEQFGRNLLRAQTFTKAEVAEGRANAELAAQKKNDFAAIAGQVGDRYPYLQGKSGSRIGAGVLALVEAACIALFQLLSKVLVLVAMLIIRLLVMTAPAAAVVAILKPEILPALLRVGGAAIVNTLVVGALAGLHSLLVVSLFRPGSGVDLWLALLVTGVVTVVLWAVARPFRRLVSMVSLTREQFGSIVPSAGTGPMSRVWQRLRGGEARRSTGPVVGGAARRRRQRRRQRRRPARDRHPRAGPGAGPPGHAIGPGSRGEPPARAGARRPSSCPAPGRRRCGRPRRAQAVVGRARRHRRPHDLPPP